MHSVPGMAVGVTCGGVEGVAEGAAEGVADGVSEGVAEGVADGVALGFSVGVSAVSGVVQAEASRPATHSDNLHCGKNRRLLLIGAFRGQFYRATTRKGGISLPIVKPLLNPRRTLYHQERIR